MTSSIGVLADKVPAEKNLAAPGLHPTIPAATLGFAALAKSQCAYPWDLDLRCGKVILFFGPCENIRQANGATALARQPVAAR